MSQEFPVYPDWASMGVSPEPTRRRDTEFFEGQFFELPIHDPDFHDPDFERRHQEWVNNLTTEQQKIYYNYLHAVRERALAGEEEFNEIRAQEFQKYGLEMGVDTEHDLIVARNQTELFAMLGRVRQDLEGREANKQFIGLIQRRSET